MFDIWSCVFVVRMRALQFRYVGVWHRVVPPNLFILFVQFIGILENPLRKKVDLLKNAHRIPGLETNLAAHDPYRLANGVNGQRLALNRCTVIQ